MAYFIDSEVTDDTVTHSKPGPLAAACQGTWTTVKKLDSSHGDSVVLVQHLEAPDDKKNVLLDQPKVFRAVKRLRSRNTWPKVDNWPTISRGLLCMARANVSRLHPLLSSCSRLGFRHGRRCAHAGVVSRLSVHLYRHGVLSARQPAGLAEPLAAPGRTVGSRCHQAGPWRSRRAGRRAVSAP